MFLTGLSGKTGRPGNSFSRYWQMSCDSCSLSSPTSKTGTWGRKINKFRARLQKVKLGLVTKTVSHRATVICGDVSTFCDGAIRDLSAYRQGILSYSRFLCARTRRTLHTKGLKTRAGSAPASSQSLRRCPVMFCAVGAGSAVIDRDLLQLRQEQGITAKVELANSS